jgi:hypothetical protein
MPALCEKGLLTRVPRVRGGASVAIEKTAAGRLGTLDDFVGTVTEISTAADSAIPAANLAGRQMICDRSI